MILSCEKNNDLYLALQEDQIVRNRFNTPGEAIDHAGVGAGVLILADGYPAQTTALDAALIQKAAGKRLRLYVEYPSFLPGVELGPPTGPRQGDWGQLLERTVVTSDAFGPALQKMRILMVHGCHYLPVQVHRQQ